MKTYVETQNEKPFDWLEALSQEEIPKDEWEYLAHLSGRWVTCACGNQCDIIPRFPDGAPIDEKLHNLGMTFHSWILRENKEEAINVLKRIEKRSKELIIQINETRPR